MEFSVSVLIRPFLSMGKGIWAQIKRPLAERKALTHPEQEKHSLYSVMENTLVHLGVEPSASQPTWKRWVSLLESKIVITETFSLPHINEWLNIGEVQEHLKHLAIHKLTSSMHPLESEQALIESYIAKTGETENRAKDIINQAVTAITEGTLSGLKDPELGILMRMHSQTMHERFETLNRQFFPEQTLSIQQLCSVNEKWLTETLSNKTRSKTRLGQVLCPGDSGVVLKRTALMKQFSDTLSALLDGGVIVVTGAEGNGKSWLVAQHWLSVPVKPLTAFIRAEDIEEPCNDISAVIINALCHSCQGDVSVHTKFWQEQFRAWCDSSKRPTCGMIVILDGINQRPAIRWAQFIDKLSEFLQCLGGKLIVTSRQHYFTQNVESRLATPVIKRPVPEWSAEERDTILALRHINIAGRKLSENVATSLLNPRMLGIALELFSAEQLHDLAELSVSLMLFEHIKASQRDSYEVSAELFSNELRSFGKKVLERSEIKDNEDIDIFDAELNGVFAGGLQAVIDGRFFTPLPEDTTRYRIHPEGLNLALGLAILDIVNKAARNHKDLDEVMASLVEPIIALDKTSDTLFAALTIASLERQHPVATGVAILVSFAGLQNPDALLTSAFMALARRRPEIFINACEHLALRDINPPQHHWIEYAILHASRHTSSAEKILTAATNWLGWSPTHLPLSSVGAVQHDADIQAKIEKRQKDREHKIGLLSPNEKELFRTLVLKDTDSLSALHSLAMKLFAGKALMPHINALVKWNFASNLNQDYGVPWQTFRDLIAFNSIDWQNVRSHLRDQWTFFVHDKSSRAGKWTAINLLMATGNSDDAQLAEMLAHQLRDNSSDIKGWHINESWCEADPCNPANPESSNVSQTAEKHSKLDVSTLFNSFGIGYQETFFSGATTSLARYRPQVAIDNHLKLAEDILCRNGLPLRQGIFTLLPHRALITPDIARKLVRRVTSSTKEDQSAWSSLGEESELMQQFQLILAFHQLKASEQLSVLRILRYEENLMMTLRDSLKRLDWQDIEHSVLAALADSDTDEQSTLLLFHPQTGPLPPRLLNALPQLLGSASQSVRRHTLSMLITLNDPIALRCGGKILTSAADTPSCPREQWHYSALLFGAINQNVIQWEVGRKHLNYIHLAQLAGMYGGEIASDAAQYFDAFLTNAFKHAVDVGALQLKLLLKSTDDRAYTLHHLSEVTIPEQETDMESLMALQKMDNFEKQQQRIQHNYHDIKDVLAKLNLSDLTNHYYPDDIAALVRAEPERSLAWANLFLEEKNVDVLHQVRHIGLTLAQVISAQHPELSVRLFERLEHVIPFCRVVFTEADLDLCAVAVWSSSDGPEIEALRWRRLALAENNNRLAHEVWAALFCQQSEKLLQYTRKCCNSSKPVLQARGIMMAGYLDQNEFSDGTLKTNTYSGLLQKSFKNASDSYQRHLWTRHWFKLMQQASSAESFWCTSVIFLQVVDERFLAIEHEHTDVSDIFQQYWPIVLSQLNSRFQKPRSKRMEHLFGGKAPWPGFLTCPNLSRQHDEGDIVHGL
ncbi:hypothetical protein GJV04_19230 [Enterobacteriaceae bacterium RIT714]|nr:hypothetical protein [Enterobacteriaceae bacterium RIT714]